MECNATIQFVAAYYNLGSNTNNSLPEFVTVNVKAIPHQTWSEEVTLPVNKLNIKALQSHCSLLDLGMSSQKANRFLRCQLEEALHSGDISRGYCFYELGAVTLPDGSLRFLRGDTLYPEIYTRPYMVMPEIAGMDLCGDGTSPAQLIRSVLLALPPQALLAVAYTVLTSVRSLVIDCGVDFQAVMYITGRNGLGKSRLVKRTSNIYRDKETGKPVGIIELSSTDAAMDALLHVMRDMPVMAEDMCLSTGRNTARKRKEQGSRLVRKGANEFSTTKKVGNRIVNLYCNAGIIITAEFAMEEESDINRCIIVPITDYLDLPDELAPPLVGDAIRLHSVWFAENSEVELNRLKTELNDGEWGRDYEHRIQTNYLCLRWAFQSLVAALDPDNLAPEDTKVLFSSIDMALDIALTAHMRMIEKLRENVPVGNLAAVIYSGYVRNMFDLAKKPEKMAKHEGIVWQGDLCLRSEALIRFVRTQHGYHDWTHNRIVQGLKDIGALVLQEETAATVHLDKDLPRVYRIRLDMLKDNMKYY